MDQDDDGAIHDILTDEDWIPDCAPRRLLPPGIEPNMTMTELLDLSLREYGRQYYLRSGRYLGVYPDQETAKRADPYRYARKFLGVKILPWEKGDLHADKD